MTVPRCRTRPATTSEIELVDRAVAELRPQLPPGRVSAGGDEHAGSGGVEPVRETGLERGAADPAQLRVAREQKLATVSRSSARSAIAGMPAGFVDGDHRRVGVENRHREVGLRRERALRRRARSARTTSPGCSAWPFAAGAAVDQHGAARRWRARASRREQPRPGGGRGTDRGGRTRRRPTSRSERPGAGGWMEWTRVRSI